MFDLYTLHNLYIFTSRLQIPVASHRHFSSLARRLGRIFAHAYFHHREAFEQAEAESSLYARFLALTERFDLVPAEFLVIPTDGHNVGVGDLLGPPPSRSPRDEHRRSSEFDRGYQLQQQQQQQQRTRYDLDLANFQHPNFPERNPSPPGPSSESTLGGIGESPSPSSRTRVGRTRTGTMVFAEAEANTVTDELAARSSLREREQEPQQKIELLERDREPEPLKTVISATTVSEEEDVQFDISLNSEIGKSGEEEGSNVASEVFEESPGPMEKHELPSLLDLKLESKEAGNTAEMAVLPSAPTSAEPGADVSTSHLSTEEEPTEPTVSSIEVIKSNESLETQPIPTETMTDHPPDNDNVSIPEPALIPKETPETAVASQPEEIATKAEVVDDKDSKETMPPSVIDDIELPTIETSMDEIPTDQAQPKAIVEVGEVVTEGETKA